MKSLIYFIIVGSFLVAKNATAQQDFYNVDSVREIKLYFDAPDWDHILDSLYVEGLENRMLASIEIDGTKFDSIGVRYKGFSSVSINRKKNPFNIKLDYILDQNYNGIEKLKLGNVIQDPSFLREVLSYDIARKYMPASRSNYAKVYINDVYWGLYTNVEPVDNSFLRKHYASSSGTFVKANPEQLDLNGENCNLSDSPGQDSLSYFSLYEMKSDYGWSHLLDLIDVLNNDWDEIDQVLNVDQTLWMHAFNYVLINFDSYIGYAQNYYLYRDKNGRFNPIIWDLNQSFASYRLTDASIHFRGFSIEEAKVMDPLLHLNDFSVHPRPLLRKLFENDRYRKMYLAHIRTIVEENFVNSQFAQNALSIQNSIDEDVKADTNKFYSYESFLSNLAGTVVDLIEYPGIIDLMEGRSTYLQKYQGYQTTLTLIDPKTIWKSSELWVNISASNAESVVLSYRENSGDIFTKIEMLDDGQHNDGVAGDNNYGINLHLIDQSLEYYFYAENQNSGRFLPERSAHEYFELKAEKDLVINEFCASNETIYTDEQGDFDDWIELYNNTVESIDLKGYYLSDDKGKIKQWTFPDTTILGNDYLIIWADKDDGDEGLHANFKLSSSGEAIILSNQNEQILDEITFSEQITDITFGRSPNGMGDFFYMEATPGSKNNGPVGIDNKGNDRYEMKVFPNPSNGYIFVEGIPNGEYSIIIYDAKGGTSNFQKIIVKDEQCELLLQDLWKGIYVINISNSNFRFRRKIIIK